MRAVALIHEVFTCVLLVVMKCLHVLLRVMKC